MMMKTFGLLLRKKKLVATRKSPEVFITIFTSSAKFYKSLTHDASLLMEIED